MSTYFIGCLHLLLPDGGFDSRYIHRDAKLLDFKPRTLEQLINDNRR
jgi:hypothetical protein